MSAVDTTYVSSTGENYFMSSTQETEEAASVVNRGDKDNVSHEDFLMLLVTQMQNQDPLNPMQDTDMMAQFAQLQQLDNQKVMTDAMVDMRHEYAVQGASSLIGKEVTSKDLDGYDATGVVVNTFTDDGSVRLTLDNGTIVTYEDITKVSDMDEAPDINAASAMVQKYVVGVDANAKAFEGIVKNITTQNGQIYLNTYEGDSIPMIGVAQVRDLTAAEKSELEDAVSLINQYVESEQLDGEGNQDGVKSGIVKDVYRKDGQYWVETWGGQGIYIKDIDSHENLTTDQMAQMETCKQYVNRFIKANNGNMAGGIVEGFFFKNDNFYLYTSRGEAVSADDIYSVRNASTDDWSDYGNVNGLSELQVLNMQSAIENNLGKSFSGYTPENEPISGTVNSIYYKKGHDGKIAIMFGFEEGGEAISPASLMGV